MDHQEIIRLFGFSEFSPEIAQLFKQLSFPSERAIASVCWRNYRSLKWDIELVFKGKNNYKSDYGPISQAYLDDHDESVLEEINFGNQKGETNYPFSLPYNIRFQDQPEIVKIKMGIKPAESGNGVYGSYFIFNTEAHQILTGFNTSDQLIWIRVMPLELSFLKKRELSRSIKKQNKHIDIQHAEELNRLKTNLPVSEWKKRMESGDVNVTPQILDAISGLLIECIDMLLAACEQKKACAVFSVVKKTVQAINKLNKKHNGFIETMEREELVEFLHEAVRLTGFQRESGTDLTEDWRTW